jgi:cytochrome c553
LKFPLAPIAALILIAGNAFAQSPDPNLGRNLAATCAKCHGTNGASQSVTENLAGMSKDDIVQKIAKNRVRLDFLLQAPEKRTAP